MPTHGFLERWSKQGVILLNAVLTVKAHNANSHAKKGWENFTDEIIRILDKESKGLVFLLWGKPASKKTESIIQRGANGRHTIICTSHPSPLGASKTSSPFLGSKCFSRANDALRERGMEPIDWNVDGPIAVSSSSNDALRERGMEPIDWNVDGPIAVSSSLNDEEQC
mmetsp:Transcript_8517/g.12136  ORF Transcript_8517/g.12136 Transcript_8517/m.12136 type:complete len:168 (+) Transcript_8517:281-784(+)